MYVIVKFNQLCFKRHIGQWWNAKIYDIKAFVRCLIRFAEASSPVYFSFLAVYSSLVSNISHTLTTNPTRSPLAMKFMKELRLKQTMSVVAQYRLKLRLWTSNWKRFGRKQSWPISKPYPSICLEGMRKAENKKKFWVKI